MRHLPRLRIFLVFAFSVSLVAEFATAQPGPDQIYRPTEHSIEVKPIKDKANQTLKLEPLLGNESVEFVRYEEIPDTNGRYRFTLFPKKEALDGLFKNSSKAVNLKVGVYLDSQLLHEATLMEPLPSAMAFEVDKAKRDILLSKLTLDPSAKLETIENASIAEDTGSLDLNLNLALSLQAKGKHSEIVKLLSPYVSSTNGKQLTGLCLLLGMTYESLKDYDGMISLYEDCIKRGSEVSGCYEPLSRAYAAKGDFKKAYHSLVEYTEAITASLQIQDLKRQLDTIEKASLSKEQKDEAKTSINTEISRLKKTIK